MDCLISFALEKVGHLVVTLKPEQSECIRYLYERKDISLAANRFGKLLCYEVPPFVFNSLADKTVWCW